MKHKWWKFLVILVNIAQLLTTYLINWINGEKSLKCSDLQKNKMIHGVSSNKMVQILN